MQSDASYLGGERAGGEAGRGSGNKVPSVAAASVDGNSHPLYAQPSLVIGFTSQFIAKLAKAGLMPVTPVISDGLGCLAAVADAGCFHLPTVMGDLKPRELSKFKWINTVLCNLKTTLAGAFRAPRVSHVLPAQSGRFCLSTQSAPRSARPRCKPHRGRIAHGAN